MRSSATAMSHGVEKLFAPFKGIRRSGSLLLNYFQLEQRPTSFLYRASPPCASTIEYRVFLEK
jgi:hypothetical protein